jgi:hypothetical protein
MKAISKGFYPTLKKHNLLLVNIEYIWGFLSHIEKIRPLSNVYIVNFDIWDSNQQGKDSGLMRIRWRRARGKPLIPPP